jgi:hypothetical protein
MGKNGQDSENRMDIHCHHKTIDIQASFVARHAQSKGSLSPLTREKTCIWIGGGSVMGPLVSLQVGFAFICRISYKLEILRKTRK